ncbi:MAG: winged helix-turn-helix transcriptional regulator [Thermoproteota archaeon]
MWRSIAKIVRWQTCFLERTVMNTRPMRTTYNVTKKGKTILNYLKQMEKEMA